MMKQQQSRPDQAEEEEEGGKLSLSLSLLIEPAKLRRRRSKRDAAANGGFECKTCKRRFPTFQALGGHRTSHLRRSGVGHAASPAGAWRLKPSVHRCSVCGLGFALGQALGGHMRRHRTLSAEAAWDLLDGQADRSLEPSTRSNRDLMLLELFK